MILSEGQIKDLILNNPGKARVNKGRQYSAKLRRHIYGTGLESYFEQIPGHERPPILALRSKYSKSNKDLFSRLARPLDKVFTARGGSVYLNLTEEAEKKARVISQDVKDGYSVRKWVEYFWKPHMLDDPFGVILLEIAEPTEIAKLRNENKSFVFPVYKSITEIYDYLPKGNRLEYLVLEMGESDKENIGLGKDDKLFRVIDDANDYYIRQKDKEISIITEHTLPNYFGEVPAMLNSDIQDPQYQHCVLSLYDEIIELAEHFLLKGSIRVAHDFLHGFPKYVEFADYCPQCKGEGIYEANQCKACSGTGKKLSLRVSDVKALEWPSKEDQLVLPANVAAYISPDKSFHEMATADLIDLENAMAVTLWGTQSRLKSQGMSTDGSSPRTATEIMDEIKPQADRLISVSEMAEHRHKFILDAVVRLQVSPNYVGSSVSYGRRYILESPDAIWLKYSDARAKGAPQNVLDTLLNEYLDANYQSDPVGLAVAKKLMYVEPFVHISATQLKALSPAPEDYKAKLYFSDWLATMNEGGILSMSVEELKKSLSEYAATKQISQAEPAAA